ncbi:Bifunctional polymyxin resistance protein ArnA [Streptomyces alboniger]
MTTPFSAVLIGEQPLLAECGEHLLTRGHQVAAVVARDPGLRRWAAGHGLRVVEPGRGLAERLRPLRFAYLFSVTNLRMLPDDVLALPERMPVNFHDALLPRHAGLHATSWAVLEGAAEHGVTWHVMEREADTGDVLKQRAVPVGPDDTAYTLNLACYEAAAATFGELVDELASGTETRTPQDLALRTYHGFHDGPPDGGLFSWRRPAADLVALVRATDLGPHRNAFGLALLALDELLFAVRKAEVTDDPSTSPPGTVVAVEGPAVVVATTDVDVRLTELSDLDGAGREPRPGDRFTELDERRPAAVGGSRPRRAAARGVLAAPARRPGAPRSPLARGRGARRAVRGRTLARAEVPEDIPAEDPGSARAWLLAALLLFLGRMAGEGAGGFDVGLRRAGAVSGPAVSGLWCPTCPSVPPRPPRAFPWPRSPKRWPSGSPSWGSGAPRCGARTCAWRGPPDERHSRARRCRSPWTWAAAGRRAPPGRARPDRTARWSGGHTPQRRLRPAIPLQDLLAQGRAPGNRPRRPAGVQPLQPQFRGQPARQLQVHQRGVRRVPGGTARPARRVDYFMYSGGKDSTYMLDKFVNEYGKRTLAYTFDVPFESTHAAQNIKLARRTCPRRSWWTRTTTTSRR